MEPGDYSKVVIAKRTFGAVKHRDFPKPLNPRSYETEF